LKLDLTLTGRSRMVHAKSSQHALNYQENRYSMSVILDATKTLLSAKQKEDERLQDYTKRFHLEREVLELHIGGQIILTKVVESMTDYDSKDPDNVTTIVMNLRIFVP